MQMWRSAPLEVSPLCGSGLPIRQSKEANASVVITGIKKKAFLKEAQLSLVLHPKKISPWSS